MGKATNISNRETEIMDTMEASMNSGDLDPFFREVGSISFVELNSFGARSIWMVATSRIAEGDWFIRTEAAEHRRFKKLPSGWERCPLGVPTEN